MQHIKEIRIQHSNPFMDFSCQEKNLPMRNMWYTTHSKTYLNEIPRV